MSYLDTEAEDWQRWFWQGCHETVKEIQCVLEVYEEDCSGINDRIRGLNDASKKPSKGKGPSGGTKGR